MAATAAANAGLSTRGTDRRRGTRPPQGVARGGVARRGGGGQASGRGVGSRGRGRGGRRRGRAAEENGGVGERGSVNATNNASDGAAVRGVMVTIQERLLIVSKWAGEAAFRVTAHASSARLLQLHLNHVMADVLKADLDGQGAGAAAASAAAATLRSSSAEMDDGTAPSDGSPMSLAALGRNMLALCRVVKAAQELYRAAELVRGLTGTTGDQVALGVADLVRKKARDWNGTTSQVQEILEFADSTMPYVGNPRRSGVHVSGALPVAPRSPTGGPAAVNIGASGAATASDDAGGAMFGDVWELLGQQGDDADEENSGGEEGGSEEGAPVGGCGTIPRSRADGGPAARPTEVGGLAVRGGMMTPPAGGRRSTGPGLQRPPLVVSPGGASGRSGRDGHPAAAAAQSDKAMADILAAVSTTMVENSRRADREQQAKSDERHTQRVADLTRLILAEPGNQMFKDLLAAEMAAGPR